MNVENFLDPMGGAGGGSINAGIMGLMGIAVDPGIFDFVYGKRVLKREAAVAAQTKNTIYKSSVERLNRKGYLPFASESISKDRLKNRINPVLSSRLKNVSGQIATQRKWTRALGWTFLASALFDAGEAMTTPGINKTAIKTDQQLFANESPMDSGRAATQRQRGLMAIYQSQGSLGRSVFGQEASYLHR